MHSHVHVYSVSWTSVSCVFELNHKPLSQGRQTHKHNFVSGISVCQTFLCPAHHQYPSIRISSTTQNAQQSTSSRRFHCFITFASKLSHYSIICIIQQLLLQSLILPPSTNPMKPMLNAPISRALLAPCLAPSCICFGTFICMRSLSLSARAPLTKFVLCFACVFLLLTFFLPSPSHFVFPSPLHVRFESRTDALLSRQIDTVAVQYVRTVKLCLSIPFHLTTRTDRRWRKEQGRHADRNGTVDREILSRTGKELERQIEVQMDMVSDGEEIQKAMDSQREGMGLRRTIMSQHTFQSL